MKVYLAARFEQKTELKALVPLFADHHLEVYSRWLDEDIHPNSQLSELTPAYCAEQAQVDLDDIDECDLFVLFADAVPKTIRGGKHVECGYAIAQGLRVVVIGLPENIFQFLPGVIHYSDIDSFLEGEGIQNAALAE
jgi:nucleoside 2-deoxyribosyltransferase